MAFCLFLRILTNFLLKWRRFIKLNILKSKINFKGKSGSLKFVYFCPKYNCIIILDVKYQVTCKFRFVNKALYLFYFVDPKKPSQRFSVSLFHAQEHFSDFVTKMILCSLLS